MNAERTYPGMCDGSLEIFYHEPSCKLMVIKGGKVMPFKELTKKDTHFLQEIIDNDEKLKNVLDLWFFDDTQKKVECLARCRFGGLNTVPDYSEGQISSPDHINCAYRGKCIGEGIICKPIVYNGFSLTPLDIKAIQFMSTDMKNTAICQELEIAEGSFNVFRTILYQKLGNIKSKQELARIGVMLGIC